MQAFFAFILAWLSFAPLGPGPVTSQAGLDPSLDRAGVTVRTELGPSLDPGSDNATEEEDGELGPSLDPIG